AFERVTTKLKVVVPLVPSTWLTSLMARPKAGDGVGDGVGVGVAALASEALQNPATCETEPPVYGPPAADCPAVPSIFMLPALLEPPPLPTTDDVIEYLSPLIT